MTKFREELGELIHKYRMDCANSETIEVMQIGYAISILRTMDRDISNNKSIEKKIKNLGG